MDRYIELGVAGAPRKGPAPQPSAALIQSEALYGAATWGLHAQPFSSQPDADFLYTNASIRQLYNSLYSAVIDEVGPFVLTGEAGTGKTSLVKRLCREWRAAGHAIEFVDRPGETWRISLMVMRGAVADEADVDPLPMADDPSPGNSIIVVDSGDRLDLTTLTSLLRLARSAAHPSGRFQLLLSGRPELEARISQFSPPTNADPSWVKHYNLERLADGDIAALVAHRLRLAGCGADGPFSEAALERIVRVAQGLPRRANLVCGRALFLTRLAGLATVSAAIVDEAARDLMLLPGAFERASRAGPKTSDRRGRRRVEFNRAMFGCVAAILAILPQDHAYSPGQLGSDNGRPDASLELVDETAQDKLPVLPPAPDPAPAVAGDSHEEQARLVPDADGGQAPPEEERVSEIRPAAPPVPLDDRALGNAHALGFVTDTRAADESGVSELQERASVAEPPPVLLPEADTDATPPDEVLVAEPAQSPPEAESARDAASGPAGDDAALEHASLDTSPPEDGADRRTADLGDMTGSPPSPADDYGLGAAVPIPSLPPSCGTSCSPGPAPLPPAAAAAGAVEERPAATTEPQDVTALVRRGDELLALGDVVAARRFYERAAATGSARAAARAGTTYDPAFFLEAGLRGITPNPNKAADWYRKAAARGDNDAESQLNRLTVARHHSENETKTTGPSLLLDR